MFLAFENIIFEDSIHGKQSIECIVNAEFRRAMVA
jgi:hypothetical protein